MMYTPLSIPSKGRSSPRIQNHYCKKDFIPNQTEFAILATTLSRKIKTSVSSVKSIMLMHLVTLSVIYISAGPGPKINFSC